LVHNGETPLFFNFLKTKKFITAPLMIICEGHAMPENSQIKKIKVRAYSGYKANERPMHFELDDRRLDVKNIIDRWYGLDHDYFKVVADDGKVYLIKWHRILDVWILVQVMERMGRH
jgi:hypothetical protein